MNDTNYDIVAKKFKGEVVFRAGTNKGTEFIRRNWRSHLFVTNDFSIAVGHIEKMNNDGLSVVLLCEV